MFLAPDTDLPTLILIPTRKSKLVLSTVFLEKKGPYLDTRVSKR